MARGKYRSAQGKMVDMNALIANNETVSSVGNMAVNARGDEILPDGTIIKTREEIMKEYHNLSTMIPEDGPIPESVSHAAEIDVDTDNEMWGNDGDISEGETEAVLEVKKPSGGLAAVVAATKKVKTNVQKPEDSKKKKGVSRI
jgi:hypothetical protein